VTTRRALLFSYVDRYVSLIVAFVASVIISRLLTPAEMGVFSVSMVLVGFLTPFRDFGASQFVIQCKVLTDDVLRTARGLQFVLGLMLAIAIAASAGVVSVFYREPVIHAVMMWLALNSLLLPIGAMSSALLTRELRFKDLAIVRSTGAVLGAAVSVVAAGMGCGPISLAYGATAGTLGTAVGLSLMRPVRVPWRGAIHEVKSVLKFGSAISGVTLLTQLRESIAELALGRLQGMAAAGLFGRAQGLIAMLMKLLLEGAYATTVPLFAKQFREKAPIGPMYLRAVGLLCAVGWSAFGLVACLSTPLIYVLYGQAWLGAVEPLQFLCLAFIVATPNLLWTQPLIAMGKAGLVFRWVAVVATVQIALVAFAARHSISAVGMAIVLNSALSFAPTVWISRRHIGFTWRQWWGTVAHSAVLAGGAMIVPAIQWVTFQDSTDQALLRVLCSTLGSMIGLVLLALLTRHPIASEISSLWGALSSRLGRDASR
jgi:O-antigen/teichoic acid export membrane protein